MTTTNKHNTAIVAMFAVAALLMGAFIVPAAAVDIQTLTIADATNQATGQGLYSGSISFYGERFTNPSNIVLIEVDSVQVELRKVGSPTGNLEVGFYDTSRNLIQSFGAKDVSTLTGSYVLYTFNLAGTGHLIQKDTILAVTYSGGDASNKVDVRRSNIGDGTDPDYDGVDSYHVNYDGSWHSYNSPTTGRDLLFKLTNTVDVDLYGHEGTDSACDQLDDPEYIQVLTTTDSFYRDIGRCWDNATEDNRPSVIWADEITEFTDFKLRSFVTYPDSTQEQRGALTWTYICPAQFDTSWFCSGALQQVNGEDDFSDADGYAEFILELEEDSGQYLVRAEDEGCHPNSPIECENEYILLNTDS